MADKSASAFRTIGEVSRELGVPQHVLRYWETKFTQLRPIVRAGNRRYYRPDDVALARRIQTALGQEGYTIKGVQRLLDAGSAPLPVQPAPEPMPITATRDTDLLPRLIAVRDLLHAALR